MTHDGTAPVKIKVVDVPPDATACDGKDSPPFQLSEAASRARLGILGVGLYACRLDSSGIRLLWDDTSISSTIRRHPRSRALYRL